MDHLDRSEMSEEHTYHPGDPYYESSPQNNTLGVISLVCGILGIIFSICCNFLGLILALPALICGIIGYQKQQQYALAGIILGAIALVLSIVFMIIGVLYIEPFMDEIMDEIFQDFEQPS